MLGAVQNPITPSVDEREDNHHRHVIHAIGLHGQEIREAVHDQREEGPNDDHDIGHWPKSRPEDRPVGELVAAVDEEQQCWRGVRDVLECDAGRHEGVKGRDGSQVEKSAESDPQHAP